MMDDEVVGAKLGETFSAPFDLLLGRRTYDIFACYWPFITRDPSASSFDSGNAQIAELFDGCVKHVATRRPESLGWKDSRWLGADVVAGVRDLARGEGPMLLTQARPSWCTSSSRTTWSMSCACSSTRWCSVAESDCSPIGAHRAR